ncbi:hypothetical protein CRUP_037572 [Coryphaenoides rupestris]|nr:hypothetical protein CRUP_037572 [Coryphaenoides rupestris]
MLVSRILNFLLPFVITIFCGHIGNSELAGYALASAVINVTTTSTGFGLAVACDTLISQTYGAQNMKRVGVILQRSVLIMLLFCLPCWGLLLNTHSLLLLLSQEQQVVSGSAIANSLSQITICLLLFGYIQLMNLHTRTWGGWSTSCLQGWGSYMQLAIPSTLMVCFEWWIWEIGSFLAGTIGEVDLAAQHVLMEIGAITYMFPLGVHAAACVRVGNALGAGDTAQALASCKEEAGGEACPAVRYRPVSSGEKQQQQQQQQQEEEEEERRGKEKENEEASGAAGTESDGAAGVLSATQLVLRRGLTLLAMLAVLSIGAAVYFAVPPPEPAAAAAELRGNLTDPAWLGINATAVSVSPALEPVFMEGSA